jgi:ketosteroid isomerase-like protein
MSKQPSVLMVLILGSFAACSAPEVGEVAQTGPCILAEEDVSWIRAMEEEHEAQIIEQDFDAMAAHWAEDILYLPPNQPEIVGKGPLREWQRVFEGVTWEHYELTLDEIVGCGDLAYVRMSFSMTFTSPGQTESVSDSGRGFHILRKQPDGTWLVTHGISNSDQPLPTG